MMTFELVFGGVVGGLIGYLLSFFLGSLIERKNAKAIRALNGRMENLCARVDDLCGKLNLPVARQQDEREDSDKRSREERNDPSKEFVAHKNLRSTFDRLPDEAKKLVLSAFIDAGKAVRTLDVNDDIILLEKYGLVRRVQMVFDEDKRKGKTQWVWELDFRLFDDLSRR